MNMSIGAPGLGGSAITAGAADLLRSLRQHIVVMNPAEYAEYRQRRKYQQHDHHAGDGKARRNRLLRRRMLRVVSLMRNLLVRLGLHVLRAAGLWFELDVLLIMLLRNLAENLKI